VGALSVDLPGGVVPISPVASTLGRDVVYTAVIPLEEQPEGLLLGMVCEWRSPRSVVASRLRE
jgi:hypothetical protein